MTEPILIAGSQAEHLLPSVAQVTGGSTFSALVERFPDGEIHAEVRADVGRRDVFVMQSLAPPAGDAALELLLLADAASRAGAMRVSAVVPYFAYARQDRRTASGQALGAKVMSRIVDLGRFAHIAVVDLHSAAVSTGFDAPVDHLTAVPFLVEALRPVVSKNAVVVAPDLGAMKLAERYARALDLPLAVVHKVRLSATEVATHGVVGEVAGKEPVIVDDMISTGATIVAAVEALRAHGCTARPYVAATHALFAGSAIERVRALHPVRVFVTDSLPLLLPADPRSPFQIVALAPLLGRAIRALHRREPIGELLSHA